MESERTPTRPPASTQDVLGTTPEKVEINPKWRRHFQRLTKMRDYLLREKGDLMKAAQEEQPHFSLHMADAGTDEYDLNAALAMISAEQNALYEVEQALSRILNGSYGTCELTGKPIPPERLDAIPWTRFTKEAEDQLERERQVQTVALGETERIGKAEPSSDTRQEE